MILGSGDIASILHDRDGALFFASGVSDSGCEDEAQFIREIKLLDQQNRDQFIFYFSSMQVFYSASRYAQHKVCMETLIKQWFDHYCIIRLGNITWGNNPRTFLNFIRNCRKEGIPVPIRDEWKFMSNKDQVLMITDNLPLHGRYEISVFREMKKVIDLV